MKLFKWEDNRLQISEEALAIKAFRQIWKRDRSKSKEGAITELGFLYFFCDPRSDYMFLTSDSDRMEKVKEGLGLPSKWAPDKLIEEAISIYQYLTNTTSSLLLKDSRSAIEKLREELRNIDLKEEINGKRVYKLQDITSTLDKIPNLVDKMQKAEKAMNSEIEENSRMRGNAEKKIFEDGLI